MSDKHYSEDRNHPPPVTYSRYRTMQTMRIQTETKYEPVLQRVVKRNRTLSSASSNESIAMRKETVDVAGLIEQIEKRNSMQDIQSQRIKPKPIVPNSPFTRILDLPKKLVTQTAERRTSLTSLMKQCSVESDTRTIKSPDSPDGHLSDSLNPIQTESQCSYVPSHGDNTNDDFGISSSSIDDPSDLSSCDEDEDCMREKEIIPAERYNEVYATERTYIEKLHVLCYVVPRKIQEICVKEKTFLHRFKNVYRPLKIILKQIYKFHLHVILPHFERCRSSNYTDYLWSVLEHNYQTIESLYKTYYLTYDENQRKLEDLCKPGSFLNRAMLQCQVYLGNLYPLTELNCANQRLLGYILLMDNYLKRLNTSSAVYEHTSSIRDELRQIAVRCEDELTISERQIKKLKARFDSKLDYFKQQRLLWHGVLKRRSPRRRIGVDQCYLLLFSKCLLVCEESGEKLEFKRHLSLENLTIDILEPEQVESNTLSLINQRHSNVTIYPFRVKAIEKCYDFLADKEHDRQKWIGNITKASEKLLKTSRMCPASHSSNPEEFGMCAPVWVNDNDVKRCQICHNRFGSTLIPSRHHCRSCGRCICTSCSTKKLVLKYCASKGPTRVCDKCFTYATGTTKNIVSTTKRLRDPNRTILFGDFENLATNVIVWIDLQDDHYLYIYGAKLDQVEEFSINLIELCEMSKNEETCTLILNYNEKMYRFAIRPNHQLMTIENDYINNSKMDANNISSFYVKLWYEAIQLARLATVPIWYERKRQSTDSGIIAT
ncbi:unnamed protein product [Adineta ricciae]|uniref:Uncharacterized protein n=1 Tax=Adineta ricciae TaxID=249248 RepID=A0A813UC06_ADIRI|nr:unnamed protein product [Adineta ricciae]CAF1336925.1 unnamed protein product [Adineta ricciae]